MSTGGRLVLVTPSYLQDLARFRLLRESVAGHGVQARHVVVVPDADVPAFRAVPHREGLEVVGYGALTPLLRPLLGVLRPGSSVGRLVRDGWTMQQLVKLLAGDLLDEPWWVCLDSDAFLLGPLDAADFVQDGRVHLQEFRGFPVGPGAQDVLARSARLLGLDVGGLDPTTTYTGLLIPFARGTTTRLLGHLETRALPWWWRFVRSRATEYAVHGLFARHLDGLRGREAVDRRWSWLFYEGIADLPERLPRLVERDYRVAMVHSRLGAGVEDYADAVRRTWASSSG